MTLANNVGDNYYSTNAHTHTHTGTPCVVAMGVHYKRKVEYTHTASIVYAKSQI